MEYFNTNKFFMTALGHWPYRSQILNRLLRILFFILFLSIDLPIMSSLYVAKDNFHKFIICIPMCISCVDVLVAYIFFIVKTPDILFLLDKISEHFKEIEPIKKEFFILKKTTEEGNVINLIYMIYMSASIVLFFTVTLTPQILDYFLPLNETRQKIYAVEMEYIFFDRDDYYWFAYVQTLICGGFSIFTLTIFDIMLYSFIQHACGMYRVLWFRLENSINIKETTDEKMIQKNVVDCILLHNKILEYVEKLDLCFTECLFITYGCIVLLMTFLGAMIVLNKSEMDIVTKYIAFAVGHIIRLLYQCVPAQRLKDHSLIINVNRYASDWYKMPVKVRKLLLLIMMRTYKESKLSCGKFFTLSMETFSTILKTIFSYLSVLLSMTS
ncbi:odorant receptor 22b-like isoform X2 [Leptopilina boulardi]|uniref:odorant receptor 22b-like isoform X2 n=1 Tax=Leptopilina boulardi TaxID=63433 RepID=UPI0021F5A3EF|nr:odorant receptor 22b-like isoform X2 [Leptopilina boulardi]